MESHDDGKRKLYFPSAVSEATHDEWTVRQILVHLGLFAGIKRLRADVTEFYAQQDIVLTFQEITSLMKIAFIITRKRNNIVVSFGTLKVQSFVLTEVRDCDLLIVVTSSTFLKRKDILKEKRQLAQIIKTRSTAYI